MKYIAMYLPQFHEIPENNDVWGKGFTEWNNVSSAVQYDARQCQPRKPLIGYYNLEDVSVMEEQSKTAQEYGIYGFCYYHYWINGHKVMYKPLEAMLNDKNVSIPFCLSWANHDWNYSPGKEKSNIFMKQEYGGEEEWKSHFMYLLPFFKDERYIKHNNRPVMLIHNARNIKCWRQMKACWNSLCDENGIKHIYFISTLNGNDDLEVAKELEFDAANEFQPSYTLNNIRKKPLRFFWKLKRLFYRDIVKRSARFSYNAIWKEVTRRRLKDYKNYKVYLGVFVDWDNTPRWKNRGNYYIGFTVDLFHKYLRDTRLLSEKIHNEYIFLNAWNEWGEGAYLEPDELRGYSVLEAIKSEK